MTVMALKHLVYIELPCRYGALKTLAAHTARSETPHTKGGLVKHTEFMSFQDFAQQSPVSDTDSNERESYWIEPHDRVLCNVVECNDTTTSSRPAERRKMSLSGERKEKDRRRKKIPPQSSDVLFGCRCAFRSQVSAQIKMHLFHQTSSGAACQ